MKTGCWFLYYNIKRKKKKRTRKEIKHKIQNSPKGQKLGKICGNKRGKVDFFRIP